MKGKCNAVSGWRFGLNFALVGVHQLTTLPFGSSSSWRSLEHILGSASPPRPVGSLHSLSWEEKITLQRPWEIFLPSIDVTQMAQSEVWKFKSWPISCTVSGWCFHDRGSGLFATFAFCVEMQVFCKIELALVTFRRLHVAKWSLSGGKLRVIFPRLSFGNTSKHWVTVQIWCSVASGKGLANCLSYTFHQMHCFWASDLLLLWAQTSYFFSPCNLIFFLVCLFGSRGIVEENLAWRALYRQGVSWLVRWSCE